MIVVTAGLLIYLIPNLVMAQKIDYEKMERDIKIAETVLETLFESSSDAFSVGFGRRESSQYLEGYGVMLRLPSDSFFGGPFRGNFNMITGGRATRNFNPDNEQKIFGTEALTEALISSENISRKDSPFFINADSLQEKSKEKMRELIIIFLLDYGDMIGQLNNEDRILVTESVLSQNNGMLSINQARIFQNTNRLSAEIKKADLNAFKSGKISREEAEERIKFSDSQTETKVEQDLELLANIFDRLYRPDLSKTYYYYVNAYYDRIPHFGVIYYLNMLSSHKLDNNMFNLPTRQIKDLDQTERDKKVKELYPAFIEELKENILSYGRTINSLDTDETLMFHVKITSCNGCGIPESLEVAIKANDLRVYNEGKTDKRAALNKIRIKEGAVQ